MVLHVLVRTINGRRLNLIVEDYRWFHVLFRGAQYLIRMGLLVVRVISEYDSARETTYTVGNLGSAFFLRRM